MAPVDDNDILYIDTSFNLASDNEQDDALEPSLTPRTLASDSLYLFKGYCSRSDWKPLLRDKNGIVVHTLKLEGKKDPMFRSEKIFEEMKAEQILPIVLDRKRWDDWMLEENVIEVVDEQTKLVHLVMRPQFGKPRDFVLAEHVEREAGSVSVVQLSASSQYLPPTSNYTRSSMALSVWHLEDCVGYGGKESTKVTYMFQISFSGWAPLARRMLTKRALVIKNVEDAVNKGNLTLDKGNLTVDKGSLAVDKGNLSVDKGSLTVEAEKPQRRVSSYQIEKRDNLTIKGELKKRVSMPMFTPPPPPPKPPADNPPVDSELKKRASHIHMEVPKLVISPDFKGKERPLSTVSISPVGSLLTKTSTSQHRHSDTLNEARKKLMSLHFDQWTATGEQNGIKGYKKLAESSWVRGQGMLEGWTADDIVAVINNYDCRKQWDSQISSINVVDASCGLLNVSYKGNFPLKPRNYCCVSETKMNLDTSALETVTASVLDDLLPANSDRSHLELEAWTVRSCGTSKRGLPLVEITLISSIQEQEASNPLLISERLLLIANIRNYLESHCVPPFLTRNAMKKLSEDFDIKSGVWNIKLEGDKLVAGAEICICTRAVPKGRGYNDGWNITVEPKTTQTIRIGQGIRIISQGGELVRVKVEPGHLGRFLVNGQSAQVQSIMKSSQMASEVVKEVQKRTHRHSSSVPSVPVQVIRKLDLQERQVLFIAFVAFVMFYLGVYYERFILNGFFRIS